jgi:2,4-dienoyl-CoA reductase-like NADH-dependent reductase (Old Yellow Enzyme family)
MPNSSSSRFLRETFSAVRTVWPERLALTARFGVLEFDDRDEQTLAEAIAPPAPGRPAAWTRLNVSMGCSTPTAQIPWGPRLPGADRRAGAPRDRAAGGLVLGPR